ncbi:PREDICTED: vestitone reductase-like [Lupinus angustifolius]|uniref:vestitone reductase-like n=1 Tax=Lupinus angustifolius TaxID=3871 RepID=UPI00092F0730|nr:PREDICTED: vestitone reductase-like [Lupinus angustifolius]
MAEGKGRICVTGGTGFIASMMIKRLLSNGFYVNTTTRSAPGKDLSFLTNLPDASKKLRIFNADLNNPESFCPAIEGCKWVFHTATPVDLEEEVETMSKRTVDGALGVLKVSLNSKTVKKVVFTASCTDVIYSGEEVDELDESYWSDIDFIYNTKPTNWPYSVSQLLAEKAVLEFGEKHGLDVVTLVLPLVIGPFICPRLPLSIQMALPWLFGYEYDIFSSFSIIHVDDVVRAHIFMIEHPNIKGRYICSLSGTILMEETGELVRDKYPEFQIPTLDNLKEIKGEKMPSLNSKKLIDAGFKYNYGMKETFEGSIQCCKANGYL